MLKLFEEYNEYYQEISWLEQIVNQPIIFENFDQDEIDVLRNTFDNLTFYLLDGVGYLIRYGSYNNYSNSKQIKYSGYIYKLPDEWYICYCDKKYYKCDQMEGLIKLLKDIC